MPCLACTTEYFPDRITVTCRSRREPPVARSCFPGAPMRVVYRAWPSGGSQGHRPYEGTAESGPCCWAGGAPACCSVSLCSPVLAVVAVHLTSVAVGHVVHDGAKIAGTAVWPGQAAHFGTKCAAGTWPLRSHVGHGSRPSR